MAFDVQGALKAGYSPAEIADFLGSENNFDVAGARKAGYKDDELVSHLTQLGKKEPTPEKPGIIAREIDRTTDAGGSDVGSEIMAVAGPKATSGYKSVLETQAPTAADQQAEIDKRLAYGAGPVSQKTVAQADLARSGLAKPANIQEQRVAEEMQRRKRLAPETGVFGQALPDQNEVSFGDLLETAKTRKQAEEDAGRGELDYLGSSLQRGWNGLNLAVNGQKMADYGELLDSFTKAYTPEQIAADPKLQEELRVRQEGFAKLAQENAQLTKTNEEILASSRTRPETKLMMGVGTKDRGWLDSAAAFGAAMIRDPGSVVDLALSSGPSSLASMATAAITYFGTRNPALAAAAGGAGSGYVEFGNEYSDNRASGMSHDDAWKAAAMKAGVVGALDAVSMRTAGKALDTISEALQTGATKTALKTVGKETLKQGALGGLGEAGGSFAAGKAIDPTSVLSEVVGEMVSAPAEAVSTRGTLAKAITPEAQFARAFEQDVANTQFTGPQTVARNLLDPNSYDARMINPAQTVDTSKISQATTVDEAIAAAHEAAGEVKPPVMPAFTAPVPPAVGPSEPTLAPMAFNAPVPTALGGRIEPTFDLNAPLTAAPIAPTQGLSPALPRLTERAPDLDLLNRVETQTSGLVAPRPQKIQGVAVSQLSDDQLKTIAADETVPAITRRGASVELTARQAETPAPTPLTGPATPPSVPLPNAPAIVDNTLTLPASEAALPAIAATPVGGQLASDTARATAQTALDRWAASRGVATPAQLTPAPAGLDAAVNGIAQALNSQFGGRIYAYNDTRPNNLNGLAIGGVGFVNTYQPAVNVGRTSLHEFKHTVEQIATLETRQGLTNTPAQKFVTQIDSIFDEMDDAGKRSYIENFLHQDELAGIADPVAREQRLQQLMQSPDTRSEMTADFLGNRATDKKFWKDVAEADPVGFKAFVDKWLSIIDNVLEALKGRRNQSTKESAQVDRYVRDLNKAKAVARDALIEYSKATRGTENGIPTTTGREGLPELAASARPELAESGGGQVPEYGTPRAGAVSVLGRHYSNESRTTLSGAYYGRGLKGAERDRLDSSPDPRLKNRIYFYVDQGSGVRPEAGVGGIAHEVRLNNIYNPESRVIKPASNFNAWESAVINAGFDGYMAPFGNNQAAVVLLGSRHSAVPVRSLGRVAGAPAPTPAAPTTLKKGLLSREAAAVDVTRIPGAQVRMGNLEIPAGERTAANAEMERIGSEVRFSAKDLGTFKDVAKDLGLTDEQYNASVLGLMTGKTKAEAFEAPKVGGIPEVVQWLDQRYRDSGMPTLDLNKAEDRSTLARMLAAEAVGAIRSAGNAVEWYDETVAKTLNIMAVKYPELNTDQNARNAFLMAVAISSQTMNVEDNLRYASSQYEAFRKPQRFPEVGTGKSAPAMAKNFGLSNRLLRDLGPVELRRFLQTEMTKRDLEGMGFKIGGESMDEKVLGSAVFGPKIGFGFYSNLTGNFEPVTMDMWFMRTVGRLTGRLPAFDEKLFPKQVAKLRAALAETGESERGVYAADFDPADVASAQQTDEGAIALARKVFSLHNRQFIKERAKFDNKTRIKTNLVGAAGAILKSADKPKDAPSSGGQRQRLRDVVRQMVDLVEKQTGTRVPPAALQALIWYPEQELYKKLGVRLRVTSQDYAGAAQSLLTKEGFDAKRINTAAQFGSRPTRPVAGKQNAGTAGPAVGAGQELGGFKGQERTAFIGRVTSNVRAQEAITKTPKEIFESLEKRGLVRTKGEAWVNARADGPQIRFVEDQFLDILAELEDSGQIKINCK